MTRKHAEQRIAEPAILSSERIILRELGPRDAAAIVDISVYDGIFATDEAEALHMLERIDGDVARGESLHWGIFLEETDELVGTCGYYRGFAGNCGEVGYILKPAYRSRGLMAEAVRLIVAYGFDALNLGTIVAYTSPDNLASMAVLKRSGFQAAKSERADLKFEQRHP